MNTLIALTFILAAAPQTVHTWNFDGDADLAAWRPNAHLTDVALRDSALHARAIEWDPFFSCDGIEIPATAWQMVIIRMRATAAGQGDLFWTGDTSGPFEGLSEDRKARFQVPGDGEWHDIVIQPFWQSAGVIRKMRLDVYGDAEFDIDAITILDWSEGATPVTRTTWSAEELADWFAPGEGQTRWSTPLQLDTEELGWASVDLKTEAEGTGALLWGTATRPGLFRQEFPIQSGARTVNLELHGVPGWRDVVALGLELPDGAIASNLQLGDTPSGPADLNFIYFGPQEGANRVGKPARVIAQFSNRGGAALAHVTGRLEGPDGIAITPVVPEATDIDFEGLGRLAWDVVANAPGDVSLKLSLEGAPEPLQAVATIEFTNPLDVPKADYVPEPKPVKTSVPIAAYYFPGWDSPAKWDPIQRVAPVRKPLLGWYDEANPEIVDWQIKWAVENGISVFLVDWYWVQGSQHLRHWLEAYNKSRYRDQLKIAIMWANHNGPGTHSAEDWAAVSDHWIAEYFPMDSYFRMNGKPAVFIWDNRAIRADLGGSDAVAAALAKSQEAAKAAGFEGIHITALHGDGNEATLGAEGYHGITTYHEWGNAPGLAENPKRMTYEDLVATVPEAWRKKNETRGPLEFYPVVDTGWDARPWHGNEAQVISGRTPALFKQLLQEAKTFAASAQTPLIVLGPVNEWGEGSYIEPATEYGFKMLEAIREVFGEGDSASWPVNIGPADIGLGPYDFPEQEIRSQWTFDEGAEGWERMMGLGDLSVANGALQATSTSRDPAFVIPLQDIPAREFSAIRIRMEVKGEDAAQGAAQLFWSRGGQAMGEAAAVRWPLKAGMNEYIVNLSDHPRWRGDITSFRFDPCNEKDATITVEEFELIPTVTEAEKAIARRILEDQRLDQVLEKARALLKTGLTAGEGYGEVWIRDLNTFIELATEVVPHAELRDALLRFFHFQGEDGNIIDGYIAAQKASVGYDFIKSPSQPDYLGHKNTVETDQESSLILAVCRYVRLTGDRSLLAEAVNGRTVTERLLRAVDFLHTKRFAPDYGLLWGGTTADWGDVQPEHEWGVVLDENSHPALDIYDNALLVSALNDLLTTAVLDSAAKRKYSAFRDELKKNTMKHLWDADRKQFRPHVYLKGSPFPADFDEAAIYYHGGTSVAIEAGLLTRAQVGEALARMRANVKAAGAASIGLTLYPAYPEGFFKNPVMAKTYSYQNGGDWTWFGGRTLSGLIANGCPVEAYEEMLPMVERVLANNDFHEWYTLDNKAAGSGTYRGAAGVLGKAIVELRAWAARVVQE